MGSLDQIIDRIQHRDRALWDVFAQSGDSPTDDQLDEAESALGFALPGQVREFAASSAGGLVVQAKEELWPLPQPLDVGPAWSFWNGVYAFSFSDEAPDWLQVGSARSQMLQANPELTTLLPVLQIDCDSSWFVTDADGAIVRVWDDGGEPLGYDGDFYDVLLEQLHDLEERLAKKLAGEDKP